MWPYVRSVAVSAASYWALPMLEDEEMVLLEVFDDKRDWEVYHGRQVFQCGVSDMLDRRFVIETVDEIQNLFNLLTCNKVCESYVSAFSLRHPSSASRPLRSRPGEGDPESIIATAWFRFWSLSVRNLRQGPKAMVYFIDTYIFYIAGCVLSSLGKIHVSPAQIYQEALVWQPTPDSQELLHLLTETMLIDLKDDAQPQEEFLARQKEEARMRENLETEMGMGAAASARTCQQGPATSMHTSIQWSANTLLQSGGQTTPVDASPFFVGRWEHRPACSGAIPAPMHAPIELPPPRTSASVRPSLTKRQEALQAKAEKALRIITSQQKC